MVFATMNPRGTLRRISDRINYLIHPELRSERCREYTRSEIAAFKAQLAASGADLPGGRYPCSRSTAYRGPGFPIEGPSCNGMLIEHRPRRPRPQLVVFADSANYYHDYYFDDSRHPSRRLGPAQPMQPPYRRSTRQAMSGGEWTEWHAAQRPMRRQHHHQRQHQQGCVQPPQFTLEELEREREAIELERDALRLQREDEDAYQTALLGVRWAEAQRTDSEPDHERPRTASAVASGADEEDNAPLSGLRHVLSTASSDSDSDPDEVYVNYAGVPFPTRRQLAERAAEREQRAAALAPYHPGPSGRGRLYCTNP
ncbi:hypothetical protein V2A60_009252 [Cordyceps javanica]|uniref:Uncharacterized protein n=1 Tax=Cordyceps javanica TaxID=43265 RepID=A0A545UTJ8_9HYPO|nr:hypothetical protein IF1G_08716 [Cordyceps javanica]TQW02108.1 hypothetical protein IF2G_10313 [Cordyceps javanica]